MDLGVISAEVHAVPSALNRILGLKPVKINLSTFYRSVCFPGPEGIFSLEPRLSGDSSFLDLVLLAFLT